MLFSITQITKSIVCYTVIMWAFHGSIVDRGVKKILTLKKSERHWKWKKRIEMIRTTTIKRSGRVRLQMKARIRREVISVGSFCWGLFLFAKPTIWHWTEQVKFMREFLWKRLHFKIHVKNSVAEIGARFDAQNSICRLKFHHFRIL